MCVRGKEWDKNGGRASERLSSGQQSPSSWLAGERQRCPRLKEQGKNWRQGSLPWGQTTSRDCCSAISSVAGRVYRQENSRKLPARMGNTMDRCTEGQASKSLARMRPVVARSC